MKGMVQQINIYKKFDINEGNLPEMKMLGVQLLLIGH
jgi:hypothetical protein